MLGYVFFLLISDDNSAVYIIITLYHADKYESF